MTTSIETASRITIKTDDGEVYDFECKDFDVSVEQKSVEYGDAPVRTKVSEVEYTLSGEIRLVNFGRFPEK